MLGLPFSPDFAPFEWLWAASGLQNHKLSQKHRKSQKKTTNIYIYIYIKLLGKWAQIGEHASLWQSMDTCSRAPKVKKTNGLHSSLYFLFFWECFRRQYQLAAVAACCFSGRCPITRRARKKCHTIFAHSSQIERSSRKSPKTGGGGDSP